MSPKRQGPLSLDEAARRLAEAKVAYDQAAYRQSWRGKVAEIEPKSNGRVVRFGHRFEDNGKVYTYAAIRADNYRGARRWFITGNSEFQGGHRPLVSPCTWVELVEFAIPGTIVVAPLTAHWQPVQIPATPEEGAPWVDLDESERKRRYHEWSYGFGDYVYDPAIDLDSPWANAPFDSDDM